VILAVNTGIHSKIKQARKRIRRFALTAILIEEKELQQQDMTQAQLQQRLQDLKKKPKIVQMINTRLQCSQ
jgi:hypothetical protein